MTTWSTERDELITPFPQPGHLIQLTYRDLEIAAAGDPDQTRLLGAVEALPRPWSPSSCVNPRLRAQLEDWLDRVAVWLNRDLCWQPADMVPGCWRQHPALVRELALLADRRWAAEVALDSDPMEEWHRITFVAFLARIHSDAIGCVGGHRDWPGRARYGRDPDRGRVSTRF